MLINNNCKTFTDLHDYIWSNSDWNPCNSEWILTWLDTPHQISHFCILFEFFAELTKFSESWQNSKMAVTCLAQMHYQWWRYKVLSLYYPGVVFIMTTSIRSNSLSIRELNFMPQTGRECSKVFPAIRGKNQFTNGCWNVTNQLLELFITFGISHSWTKSDCEQWIDTCKEGHCSIHSFVWVFP